MKPFDVIRPWGLFREFTRNEVSTVKIIFVKAGNSLSLQTHKERDEFWKILQGEPSVTIGDTVVKAEVDQEYFIPRGTAHRIAAIDQDVKILEIALGNAKESDIVRLEDKYGRA